MRTTNIAPASQEEAARVLAYGNAVLAELGMPPSSDISALARSVHESWVKHDAAARKLEAADKVLTPVFGLEVRKAEMAIVPLLGLDGPISTEQIVRRLAHLVDEYAVSEALESLMVFEHIVGGPWGWTLIGEASLPWQHREADLANAIAVDDDLLRVAGGGELVLSETQACREMERDGDVAQTERFVQLELFPDL